MKSIGKIVRINDEDWETMRVMAQQDNVPLNRFINQLFEAEAKSRGLKWNGMPKHGGYRRKKQST